MKKFLYASVFVLGIADTAQASVTNYTSEAAFDAALVTFQTETFSTTTLLPGLSFTSNVGSIGSGVFNDRVSGTTWTTIFSFTPGIKAFGAIWDERPGGFGAGLVFSVPGTLRLDGYSGQFYGFISTTDLTSVTISAERTEFDSETYNLDNLKFSAAPSAVPEPMSLAVLGAGMLGLGVVRRRSC